MMARNKQQSEGETFSFISGLLLGIIIGAPIAAWMSPRSGEETRQEISQRGMIIRRRIGETIRKPIEQVQGQLRGDSVQEALDEGKSIAARRSGRDQGQGS